jgi:hypothetical protein
VKRKFIFLLLFEIQFPYIYVYGICVWDTYCKFGLQHDKLGSILNETRISHAEFFLLTLTKRKPQKLCLASMSLRIHEVTTLYFT